MRALKTTLNSAGGDRLACYVELTGVGPFEGATVRADAAGRITVFNGYGDDPTMAKLVLSLGAVGNVRTLTMRAFPEPEYRAILASL